jgi:hypothetical protein
VVLKFCVFYSLPQKETNRRGSLSSKIKKFLYIRELLSSKKRKSLLREEKIFPHKRGNLSAEEETSKETSPQRRGNLSS